MLRLKEFAAGLLMFFAALAASGATLPAQVLRWAEGQPDCAFHAADDGTYRYALVTDDFSITLAMDAQELEKARRRVVPILALFLSVRFFKQDPPQLVPDKVTLEFVKHFQEKETPLDSARLLADLQARDDKDAQAAAHLVRKHSERKEEIEAALKAQQHNTSQMIEWVQTKTLRSVASQNNEVSGWLLFAAKTRWIGELNRQEEFLLRVPLGDAVVEFPFTLPPSQGDIRLRKRSEE